MTVGPASDPFERDGDGDADGDGESINVGDLDADPTRLLRSAQAEL